MKLFQANGNEGNASFTSSFFITKEKGYVVKPKPTLFTDINKVKLNQEKHCVNTW